MAVTKILARKSNLRQLVRYVMNPEKTEEKTLVSTIGCSQDHPEEDMIAIKKAFGKMGGVQAHHLIQSFTSGEITPEKAHELGIRLAQILFDDFQVVIATHVDKEHIHNHLAINSVSDLDGHKYHSNRQSYFREIRKTSDELCREYGLSIIEPHRSESLSYAEWKMHQAGFVTFKDMLRTDIETVISMSLGIGDFYDLMESKGYLVQHHSKYPSFIPSGTNSAFRAKLGGKSLTEDDIRDAIERSLDDPKSEILEFRYYKPVKPYGKAHGFKALYLHWMYVLGYLGEGARVKKGVIDYSEMRKLEQYKRQAAYLESKNLDTPEQLNCRMAEINRALENLYRERELLNQVKHSRKKLYNALAQSEYYRDAETLFLNGHTEMEKAYQTFQTAEKILAGEDRETLQKEKRLIYEKRSDINSEIRKSKSEQKLCLQILEDSKYMENCLQEMDGIYFPPRERARHRRYEEER
jgi:hypothetical protein